MIQVLYKGKGDVNDTSKCRGITLKCSTFKSLTRPLTERHQAIIESIMTNYVLDQEDSLYMQWRTF
jgi:hypothetical protein